MSGVFLSLNQGTTYLKNKYKNRKPRQKMNEVANKLKSLLDYSNVKFPETEINLFSTTENAKNYMAAHICGKYYSVDNLPNNQELINDLRDLIIVYSQLYSYMGMRDTDQFIDYLLTLDEVADTQFQSDTQLAIATNTPKQPQQIPPQSNIGERKGWQRNVSIAKEALEEAMYLCEIDPHHKTFISEVTGENFVEAHHLIPMNNQSNFKWSLDVPGNIVSLCPNCHRKIHHAKKVEKETIIEDLFNKRFQSLEDFGVSITVEDLKKFYNS